MLNRLTAVFFILFLSTDFLVAQNSCYIQIKSESGLYIFIDDDFKGVTNEAMEGFIVKNISEGVHDIRIVKDGYNPQEKLVELRPNEIYVVEVKPFSSQNKNRNKEVVSASESNPHDSKNEVKNQTIFTDSRDGKIYKTIKIGSQIWMAENLAYLPFRNSTKKSSKKEPLYYVYGICDEGILKEEESNNVDKYNVLYNWIAASTSCPDGWHLPTDDEWGKLEKYINDDIGPFQYHPRGPLASQTSTSYSEIGYHLKSKNGWKYTKVWDDSGNGIDTYGFSALPCGYRKGSYGSEGLGNSCYWWSSTATGKNYAYRRSISSLGKYIIRDYSFKHSGFSVRCVKD